MDDKILAGNNMHEILKIRALLNDAFKIENLVQVRYFLGLEFARIVKGISV